MRDIVLSLSVSLDGFFEGPGGDISWHRVDDELHQHLNDRLRTMGGFLTGRATHELMAAYWPTADAGPAASGPTAEFAGIWRSMPKTVYSRTLAPGPAPWNATVVPEVVVADVRALKAQEGGDLVVGGPNLAATFLRHGLVDEFRTYVHPVLVGGGTRLFPEVPFAGADRAVGLRLVESRTFGNGVVLLRHRVDADDPALEGRRQ
ncbi:dihydrofolate reductase family protein [Streptomyces sp. NBC_01497]|uniref:dihydrofolate reductase family protein n=1 Tax=Streptomyces sp. NBC_01497 TaxID=2903885 RepID=UPI002E360FA2|nr:dihydrofolate reductase family protein [Streptomyces sp. NBC_01497]